MFRRLVPSITTVTSGSNTVITRAACYCVRPPPSITNDTHQHFRNHTQKHYYSSASSKKRMEMTPCKESAMLFLNVIYKPSKYYEEVFDKTTREYRLSMSEIQKEDNVLNKNDSNNNVSMLLGNVLESLRTKTTIKAKQPRFRLLNKIRWVNFYSCSEPITRSIEMNESLSLVSSITAQGGNGTAYLCWPTRTLVLDTSDTITALDINQCTCSSTLVGNVQHYTVYPPGIHAQNVKLLNPPILARLSLTLCHEEMHSLDQRSDVRDSIMPLFDYFFMSDDNKNSNRVFSKMNE